MQPRNATRFPLVLYPPTTQPPNIIFSNLCTGMYSRNILYSCYIMCIIFNLKCCIRVILFPKGNLLLLWQKLVLCRNQMSSRLLRVLLCLIYCQGNNHGRASFKDTASNVILL